MSVSQARHMKAMGYAQDNALLTVTRAFTHLTSDYAVEAACPSGLTDAQTRRLISGRYLG